MIDLSLSIEYLLTVVRFLQKLEEQKTKSMCESCGELHESSMCESCGELHESLILVEPATSFGRNKALFVCNDCFKCLTSIHWIKAKKFL